MRLVQLLKVSQQSQHVSHVLTHTDAPERKPYDVPYKVRTPKELADMQKKEIAKIQELLAVPVSGNSVVSWWRGY
jgi:hypothetical protein